MKSKHIIGFILASLIFSTTTVNSDTYFGERETEGFTDICPRDDVVLVEESRNGLFKVTISRTEDFTCHFVVVSFDGKTMFQDSIMGGYFYLGANYEANGEPFATLTGPGHQNVVISSWSGGAHCCFTLRIFDVTDGFRQAAYIDSGNFMAVFEDLDFDGIPEIKVTDDFLAYQFSSFAESATADVVLKYSEGEFIVAPEFMLKAPLDLRLLRNEITEWRRQIREANDLGNLPYSFMKTVTDLTFSGNWQTAEQLVELTWPSEGPSKKDFLIRYEMALAESKFYTKLL
ncbi:MAG: hypothetical protein KDD38_01670 [Bdellovibrionales bacterium]|nr:hypothetical protein [Bdellovibrionales bacterium]